MEKKRQIFLAVQAVAILCMLLLLRPCPLSRHCRPTFAWLECVSQILTPWDVKQLWDKLKEAQAHSQRRCATVKKSPSPPSSCHRNECYGNERCDFLELPGQWTLVGRYRRGGDGRTKGRCVWGWGGCKVIPGPVAEHKTKSGGMQERLTVDSGSES